MTKILMRSPKDPFHVMTTSEVLQRSVVGGNTGNLLFSTAVHKFLLTEGTEITPNQLKVDPGEADRINEEYDLFVVPLANAFRLNLKAYLQRLTQLIERLRIPVIIFGVGVQTDLDYDLSQLAPIDKTVQALVRAVLDRSTSIGVRGECTAEYLRGLGFRDIDVIGCPSMFLGGDTLQVEKKAFELDRESWIAVSTTTRGPHDRKLGNIVTANHERFPNLLYVAQSHRDLELLYWGDTSLAAGRRGVSPVHRSHPLLCNNAMRAFLDPAVWIEALSRYDFAFGSRIHGNIAALLAGTPSAVLCHDSRTLELCRYFEIPHRKLPDVPDDLDAAELYAWADHGPLVNGHKERFNRLVDFMDKNGLDHVFSGGDRGAAFDDRMRRTELPPGIGAWDGRDDGDLGHRVAWLKENISRLRGNHAAAAQHISELTSRNTTLAKENTQLSRRADQLEQRLAALERQLGVAPATPPGHARRGPGRTTSAHMPRGRRIPGIHGIRRIPGVPRISGIARIPGIARRNRG